MTRFFCGVLLIGMGLALEGCAFPSEQKPNLVGAWERDNGRTGVARIVWRLEFKDGGSWQKETENIALAETKTVSGSWKRREVQKSLIERGGETIKPDFHLDLEYWLSDQADEIPVGATIVERSSDGQSMLVRETWNAAIRMDKASGEATLTLFRFDTNTVAGSDQIKAQTEKYDRVD